MSRRSKVLPVDAHRWPVALKPYKDGGDLFRDVTRQTLLGEGEGEEALSFLTRYFEVAPGGFSSLERHQHPHAVVVVRGRGTVQLGEENFPLGPLDCVYVAPGEPHQFRADRGEPLGFLCTVDRDRDRPVAVIRSEEPRE
ncbi:MAG: cupin domain-containing protein [Thermoanaerobaculia bacterium]